MKRNSLCIASLLLVATLAYSQNKERIEIEPAAKSANVLSISHDTIYVADGTTYAFTVDTPEQEGLKRTGLTVADLPSNILRKDGKPLSAEVTDRRRHLKLQGFLYSGDNITIDGTTYKVTVKRAALNPTLEIRQSEITTDTRGEIALNFTAGQRSPKTTVRFFIPKSINVTPDNTFVNVIGRGEVSLRNLPQQSIGRTGTNYSYKKVGTATISPDAKGRTVITFSDIDLRPLNGADITLRIFTDGLSQAGSYEFGCDYTTSEPETYGSKYVSTTLNAVDKVSNLSRTMPVMFTLRENETLYTSPTLYWSAPQGAQKVVVEASSDGGKTWSAVKSVKPSATSATIEKLDSDKYYKFRLSVEGGKHAGKSNTTEHYTGKIDIRTLGVKGDGTTDDTEAINRAIKSVNSMGGGVITFPAGKYSVRTVQLLSNVWLHVSKDAVINCLRGTDAPETTWFSDRAYRSGLSPTDPSPYEDPENYLTKQDVGHTYFYNTMFFAERQRNIKIFGNGTISGNGNLTTGDRVMNNRPDNRADKMFTFKLCTQVEIGGYDTGRDMWYDPEKDEPYYIEKGGKRDYTMTSALNIDRGGHFVLLATGTDTVNIHDTYLGRVRGSARDIYDFMACNRVTVTNIYSKMSSDDIVKLGSDCSLGFTRPVSDYLVRNIIGDTNCNLFQIGSETADDIQDVYVDNIYVLGANKAGFSISTNDGAHIRNIFLNTGHTGKIHSRSMMYRTRAPFFISISNRGRVIGADVKRFRFKEAGGMRDELLVTNSNIGAVENVVINDIDIFEVYGGSSHSGPRWKAYDGSQSEATPIIAGYKLPDTEDVEGGLGFTMPNGKHTGYITNIEFNRVNLLVKGDHPDADAKASPPEIGVGRYNVGDLRIQPAYGFWFRHAKNVVVKDCRIDCEKADGRHAIVLDDVVGANISNIKIPAYGAQPQIHSINSKNIMIKK